MLAANIPLKVPSPFGSAQVGGSLSNVIPTTTATSGDASWVDGFTSVNDTPLGSGGIPPRIQDFNGLFNQISAICQWLQAGGPWPYDSAFQTAIGGYPLGCKINSATFGNVWISTVDNNMTNPDTGGAGWLSWRAMSQPCTALSAEGVVVGTGYTGSISATIYVPTQGWIFATGGINLSTNLTGGLISASLLIDGAVTSADQTLSTQFHQGYAGFSTPGNYTVSMSIVAVGTLPTSVTATYRCGAHFIPRI